MPLQAKKPSGEDGRTLTLTFGNVFDDSSCDGKCKNVMPAEWFRQTAVQLTWPHNQTDWKDIMEEVTDCYLHMAYEIASRQKLIIVGPTCLEAKALIDEKLPKATCQNISYLECPTNDTWARDHAFISVMRNGSFELLDFKFNGWGNKFEAEKDNQINAKLFAANLLKGEYVDCLNFVLEGGSIESDGVGTILTTSECLLSKERNPKMTKEQIEEYLEDKLCAKRILWLNHGALEGDDTDSHIDTLARFCNETTIAYTKCYDSNDSHFDELNLMEEELKQMQAADGKAYKLIPLPLPAPIYDDGERLPATYANFLIMNDAVLLPTYGQKENDALAKSQLQKAFPRKEIVEVNCLALIKQHGSLHCSTMQYFF